MKPVSGTVRWLTIIFALGLLLACAAAASPGMQPEAVLKTPENRTLSPFTGYTRAHWIEITQKLIAGIMPYFDPQNGMPYLRGVSGESGHFSTLHFVGGEKEAFERSLMMAAVYTAATGSDTVPGYQGSIAAPYLKGIIEGTNPKSRYYWGKREKYEAFGTVIGSAVLISPRFFWDPLTEQQKKNLLDFFEVLSRTVAYDCNHWYFHMVAVPILDKNGRNSNREFLTGIFERILGWYRGDGWFIDGGNYTFDYYNLWGFQLYNHFLCHYDQVWRERFSGQVNRITDRFMESYPYLYGRDGGPVPWGRSNTYRFASLSALAWPMLNHACTLPPGQARRIASGCLKYFWDHGCLSENGLLEPGFRGPNTVVAENYIDRGAPYWAAQGLACLLIPENDPFWTAEEQPMPADGLGGRVALPGAEMVVRVRASDGDSRVYPVGEPVGHQGQWQRGIKYFQHAYSSFMGYCALGEGGPDLGAGRTGASYDGKNWWFRTNPRPLKVDPYHCVSVYDMRLRAPEPDLEEFGEVFTHTLIGENGEVHVFWHNSSRPAYLWLGGYGICVPPGTGLEKTEGEQSLRIKGGENCSLLKMVQAPSGKFDADLLEPRPGWTYSHNFDGKGAFPFWRSDSPVPPNTPVVAYVDGSRGKAPIEPVITVCSQRGLLQVTFEGVTRLVEIPF